MNHEVLIERLEEKGVRVGLIGSEEKLRAVTHLGVDEEDILEASKKIKSLVNKLS